MAATAEGAKAAVSRIEELRRILASTPDPVSRARLRVELSDLLRARADPFAALTELRRAAGEAPQLTCVRLALLSAAAALPPGERAMLLSEHARGDKGPVAVWAHAAAAARAENGAVEEATRAFLELAGDARIALHRRRAAARRAAHLAAERSPRQQIAALRLQASLSNGRARLALLRRVVTIAERAGDGAIMVAVAQEWLAAGGAVESATLLLGKARVVGGGVSSAVTALEAEIARRGPQRAPRLPSPATGVPTSRRSDEATTKISARAPRVLMDEALTAARAGRHLVARRRAERALQATDEPRELMGLLSLIEAALKEQGATRDALMLRRAWLQTVPTATSAVALAELADAADAAGIPSLAATIRGETSRRVVVTAPRVEESPPRTPFEYFLAAQRGLARRVPGGSIQPVMALLVHAVAGHPAADDALALGEKLLRQAADPDVETQVIDLLREANGAEVDPKRRAAIAERLASALETQRDPLGAVAVLNAALEAIPADVGVRLRARRARLLRDIGRPKDLAVALQLDIPALDDDARRDAFAERARLLDAAGDPDAALEIRLAALNENPADLPILSLARQRLDQLGRFELSLRLATSAVVRLTTPGEKLPLLRDIARLNETTAHNLHDAAAAWVEVARLDPGDHAAADAAERLLMATGEWERCASLLAWRLARAPHTLDAAAHAALLWRLAELRRERLAQDDEALRLYALLGKLATATPAPAPDAARDAAPVAPATKTGRRPMPALAQPTLDLAVLPAPSGSLGRALALRTLRAAVAPTRETLALALLDRALFLADPMARTADAQRDLARALELDPRNVDVVVALERITERTGRWTELAEDFRQKAATSDAPTAARLWYGVGRISERLDHRDAAGDAYRQACALDTALLEPISALRRLAAAAQEWPEVARLLDLERALVPTDRDHAQVAAELALVLGEHLGQPARAVELLESAVAFFPDDAVQLRRLFDFNLLVGGTRWEQAGQILDRLLAQGVSIDDAAEAYFRVGEAAAADGQVDRALGFYSRAYGRDSSFRPNLERLSQLCFKLEQWDNAWKATEGLLERHRAALPRVTLAECLLRSASCDVTIAQRVCAAAKLAMLLSDGGRFAGDGGVRDVAESWSGMGLEPRLLVGLDGERRERALKRAGEALSLAAAGSTVRVGALNLLAAVAMVESRWADALRHLGELSSEEAVDPPLRAGFLIAAGDIHLREGSDPISARALYERARVLAPHDERLHQRLSVPVARDPVPSSDPIFADDEEPTGVDLDHLTQPATSKHRT